MSDLTQPWYDWETKSGHQENNVKVGDLSAFTSPSLFLPVADAVIRYRPDVICDVHAYKMGMTAFLAATSHHLAVPVWSINCEYYEDGPYKERLTELGLSDHVEYITWNPFLEDAEHPVEAPAGRLLIFLNVNVYSAIERSLGWLLGSADEALIIFHAVDVGGTRKYISDLSAGNDVSPWVHAGPRDGHWCEGGFLLWKRGGGQETVKAQRRTIVERGMELYAPPGHHAITDYAEVVEAVRDGSTSDFVLSFAQARIWPIQDMVKDESLRLHNTSWKAVSDHNGSNFLVAVGLLRVLQQKGASVSILIPPGSEVGKTKTDVARRFGVPVENGA